MKLKLAALTVFLITACASNHEMYKNFESAPLAGMVYDLENQPVSGMKITFDRVHYVTTDVNGRFSIMLNKGVHPYLAKKDDYEPIRDSIDFSSPMQILYLKVSSSTQLLSQAKKALTEKKWDEVASLLSRVEQIKKDDPLLQYYQAVYYICIKQWDKSVLLLEAMLADNIEKEPLMLLADLYAAIGDKNREASVRQKLDNLAKK